MGDDMGFEDFSLVAFGDLFSEEESSTTIRCPFLLPGRKPIKIKAKPSSVQKQYMGPVPIVGTDTDQIEMQVYRTEETAGKVSCKLETFWFRI